MTTYLWPTSGCETTVCKESCFINSRNPRELTYGNQPNLFWSNYRKI